MKYTAGELAKKLGVSARTVRFYDEKSCCVHVNTPNPVIDYMMKQVWSICKRY